MSFSRNGFPVVLILSSLVLTSCGKDNPADSNSQDSGNHKVVASMSAEERARYCVTDAPAEEDPQAESAFLEQLNGSWRRYPINKDDIAATAFEFSAKDRSATHHSELAFSREHIFYRKICVSKVLDASDPGLAGFRIVEMMADNNEGGVVLAMKLDAPTGHHRNPTLQMTDRVYHRWASQEKVVDFRTVLKDLPIYVFPERN